MLYLPGATIDNTLIVKILVFYIETITRTKYIKIKIN